LHRTSASRSASRMAAGSRPMLCAWIIL
jgi:hypothetical protein